MVLLGAILAAGCTTPEAGSATASPKGSAIGANITKAEAERIVLQQFKHPSRVQIVGTTLKEGIWYVLVEWLPASPGGHTMYHVRATDGVIVGCMGGA
jgi:hypothetical protein